MRLAGELEQSLQCLVKGRWRGMGPSASSWMGSGGDGSLTGGMAPPGTASPRAAVPIPKMPPRGPGSGTPRHTAVRCLLGKPPSEECSEGEKNGRWLCSWWLKGVWSELPLGADHRVNPLLGEENQNLGSQPSGAGSTPVISILFRGVLGPTYPFFSSNTHELWWPPHRQLWPF